MANTKNGNLYNGALWSFIDIFFRQAITFAVFLVLARMLEPGIFGLMASALLFVQIFGTVVFDSIATAIIRKHSPSDIYFNTGFWFCISISLCAFLLLFFTADLVERVMNIRNLADVIKGVSFITLTSGLSRMHEVWLTRRLEFRTLAIRSSISVVLGGVVGVYMASKGYGIYSLIAQQLVTAIVQLALLWFLTPWKPKLFVSKKAFVDIYSFGKHVAVTGITNFANQNSDIMFVSYFLGASATGIYTTAKRIPNTLNTVITSSLLRVSLPAFSKLQKDEVALKKAFLESTLLTAMVSAPIFIGLAVISRDVILLILGEKWLEIVPVVQLITIVAFLPSIGQFNQNILLIKNKPQWQARLRILYTITDFCLFFIFTRFGLMYTAIVFSARAILLYPLPVWCALRLLKLSWKTYIKAVFPSLLASAVMAAIIIFFGYLLQNVGLPYRPLLLMIIGGISYSIIGYFLLPRPYKSILQSFLVKRIKNGY